MDNSQFNAPAGGSGTPFLKLQNGATAKVVFLGPRGPWRYQRYDQATNKFIELKQDEKGASMSATAEIAVLDRKGAWTRHRIDRRVGWWRGLGQAADIEGVQIADCLWSVSAQQSPTGKGQHHFVALDRELNPMERMQVAEMRAELDDAQGASQGPV